MNSASNEFVAIFAIMFELTSKKIRFDRFPNVLVVICASLFPCKYNLSNVYVNINAWLWTNGMALKLRSNNFNTLRLVRMLEFILRRLVLLKFSTESIGNCPKNPDSINLTWFELSWRLVKFLKPLNGALFREKNRFSPISKNLRLFNAINVFCAIFVIWLDLMVKNSSEINPLNTFTVMVVKRFESILKTLRLPNVWKTLSFKLEIWLLLKFRFVRRLRPPVNVFVSMVRMRFFAKFNTVKFTKFINVFCEINIIKFSLKSNLSRLYKFKNHPLSTDFSWFAFKFKYRKFTRLLKQLNKIELKLL